MAQLLMDVAPGVQHHLPTLLELAVGLVSADNAHTSPATLGPSVGEDQNPTLQRRASLGPSVGEDDTPAPAVRWSL